MFGNNDNIDERDETVEHFGKRKTKVKISGKAVIIIILVILAIALFAYIGSQMDKSGSAPTAAAAPAATGSLFPAAKPAVGGFRYRK